MLFTCRPRRRAAPLALLACAACPRPAAPPADAAPPVDATAPAPDVPPPPASDLPLIALGADAYREWWRLPYLRIGARAYMRSTYDRAGGNEAADASHFIRQQADGTSVTLDVEGRGALLFVRTNHWHGSPWHYAIDGADHVVTETSTQDPDHPTEGSVFLPAGLFPSPLAWTWSDTRGADLNWVPLPFEHALTLAYGRTHYGTGYYIFQLVAEGTDHLRTPLHAWDGATPPASDVLALVGRAGEDIAPAAGDPDVRTREGALDLPGADAPALVTELTDGPAVVRALRLSVPRAAAEAFAGATLRVTWDGRAAPSIEAPVALFFGAGTLRNPDGHEFLVRGLLANIRFDADRVTLAMYYPMPYQRGARVELVSRAGEAAVPDVRWQLRAVPYRDPANHVGYFHASYRDHTNPEPGRDLVLLDTTEAEGGGDWCGAFAGTSFVFTDRAELSTLEGDPRFFFDDSQSPQGQGTGTEEWGGGGDYWGGRTMTLPFAGHPVGVWPPTSTTDPRDLVHSAYRLLLADAMPFGRNARIQLEHGATDESTEHYRTVTYWYGAPGACLVPSDALHVGDAADEQAHRYVSPTAGPVETITSRYEWGVDHLGATEVYPATTDSGRRMTGTSEFTLRVLPANVGVMLRRTLDYAIPDQRAEVFVAEDRDGAAFERVGVWYTAGGSRSVYSNPDPELGDVQHVVQTSNRRFRDDEFLLPRRVTAGRSAIRVRVVFAPVMRPLFPGDTAPGTPAWSEIRYHAYSYVLPPAP